MWVSGEWGLLLILSYLSVILLELSRVGREVAVLAILAFRVRVVVVEGGLAGYLGRVHSVLGFHGVGLWRICCQECQLHPVYTSRPVMSMNQLRHTASTMLGTCYGLTAQLLTVVIVDDDTLYFLVRLGILGRIRSTGGFVLVEFE